MPATAIGWGNGGQGVPTYKLQEVELDIVKNRQCANFPRLKGKFKFLGSMMCAGRKGNDVCQGLIHLVDLISASETLLDLSQNRLCCIGTMKTCDLLSNGDFTFKVHMDYSIKILY